MLSGKQGKVLGAKPKAIPRKLKKPAPAAPPQGSAAPPQAPLRAGLAGKLKGLKPA